MLGSDALAQENWGWSDHNRPFIAPNVSMIHQKSKTFKWKITNLKSGALTSSPTFSPQPLCLDVVQLEFHSHLVQVDWVDCLLPFRTPFLVTSPQKNSQPRPPPQKKTTKSWIQSEKKQQIKRQTKRQWSSDTPFIHLAIWRYLLFFYDFAKGIIWKSQQWWEKSLCQDIHGENCKKFVQVNLSRLPKHPPGNPSQHNWLIIDLTGGKSHSLKSLFLIWAWSLNSCFA